MRSHQRLFLRFLFFSLFFIEVSLITPSLFAGMMDPSLKWKTIETKHFSIHFYGGEEEVAQRLARISEEVYGILSKKFDARPWGRTQVVVTDNNDAANGYTQVIPYNHILIRVVPPEADNILNDYDDWLRELFTHEYTHVLHITDTRYPAKLLKFLFGKLIAPNGISPGWVTEGIATYFETAETTRGRGRASFTDMLLRTDILNGHFLHLDQMAGTQYEWPSWMAQYLYGVGFWEYLAETYGEEAILKFSHKYGASLWFFSLNNKARRAFKDVKGNGKSFYELWDDWKKALEKRYGKVREEVTSKGLQEGDSYLSPKKGESFSLPTLSPDGKSLVYLATSIHHRQELRLRDLETKKERVLLSKKDVPQVTFSSDGKKILLSHVAPYKRYYRYQDLHEIDLATGKIKQLTRGKRARDPDLSPDGKSVITDLQGTGFSTLAVYDLKSEKWKEVAKADHFDHPRWLPDGQSVVVSMHENGQQDLWIFDVKTGKRRRITSNSAIEDHPVVDAAHHALYFSSDQTGIQNIYRYDLESGRISQTTNVLTGAFVPTIAADGSLLFQYYNGKGYEIRRLGALADRDPAPVVAEAEPTTAPDLSSDKLGPVDVKPYHPFKRLFVPRYLLPNLAILDNSVFVSGTIGNMDPLFRHQWFGDVTYRSDDGFVGFDTGYTYARLMTPISVGFSDFAVNYGDVFGLGADFFEERRRGYTGIFIPLPPHSITLNYFFENRSEESGLPAGTTLRTLGNYAGFLAQYAIRKNAGTAAQISPEGGGSFTTNVELTDHLLGSSEQLEQEVVWADARSYLRVPFTEHHVIALRAAGGSAFGDQLLQGNFGLGGSLGESPFSGTSTRLFTLRGLPLVTFSRDRAWVASAEYRMPLFRVQRGVGTLPFALNSAHFALFADVGDAFNRNNASFRPLLGVGAELRGDFVLAYSLPIMGRLGYGIIVTHRERLGGLTDPLTGGDARNGVLVLEVGTSF